MGSHRNHKLTDAFNEGVQAATDKVTVVVDKSEFKGLSELEKAKHVESLIRERLPEEQADKFMGAVKQETIESYEAFADPEILDLLVQKAEADGFKLHTLLVDSKGDGAFSSDQSQGGVEFCTVEHGALEGRVDEMALYISQATGANIKDIRKNFTAGEAEHAKRLGAHEAQHCEGSSGLHGESHADKESYDNISPEAALEYRDFRAITAMYDAGHASNPIVMGNQPSGDHFLEAKVGMLHSGVSRVFDSVVEDYMGIDNGTHSSQWNIGEYSDAVDEMKQDMINSALEMPDGPDKTEALIVAEAVINYAEDYEDAYRRRALGENIPERRQMELVSLEEKESFYQDHFKVERYEKENVDKLHSDIKEAIKDYHDGEELGNWEEKLETPGSSMVTMGNVQESSAGINTHEISAQQAKPSDLGMQ
jgi:hypothetical protein